MAEDGTLTVTIPRREGRYRPWWKEIRVESMAAAPQGLSTVDGKAARVERFASGVAVTLTDNGGAHTVVVR
jgi:alpha-glucosidase